MRHAPVIDTGMGSYQVCMLDYVCAIAFLRRVSDCQSMKSRRA